MKPTTSRRKFLAVTTTAAAGFSIGLPLRAAAAEDAAPEFKTRLYKALIMSKPTEDGLKRLKDAGLEGVEGGVIPVAEAEKCRAVAEKVGMKIHSVLRGWAEFNSPDEAKVKAGFKLTEDALRTAQAFGADAVLLVPCKVGGMKIPKPREFDIQFDEKTGQVSRVVAADNAPYAAYIEAQNRATETSREAVKRLIPLAEQTGVVIALENVWNNLWVQPAIFKNFVASFQSKWVKAYFDIGNHVKYAPPQEWIAALGSLIAKIHIKDFKMSETDPNTGDFVNIRKGSVNWPVVRRALDQAGYNGWLTIEGGDLSLAQDNECLNLIIAGK